MRRKQFEAKLLATEVNKMLFGGESAGNDGSLGIAPNGDKIITADQMLAEMGITF